LNRRLATRLEQVAPSASMSALAEVARLRAEGREVLSLTIGEPDFPTPPHVIQAAIDALNSGQTGYRPTNGIPALQSAIIAAFHKGGLAYTQSEVTIGAGAKQLIFAAFAATIDEGDEIIIPTPYWVSYPDIGTIFGAKTITVPCSAENGFKLAPSDLKAALTTRSRWLVLNSPNNPSGAVYSRAELAALGAVLDQFPDCLILSDEIYEHLVYDGAHISFALANPQLTDRTLTVNGVSKAYSMTGFRLGYAGGPGWLIAGLNTILTQDTTCPSSISQLAAVAALTGSQDTVGSNRREYMARRDHLVGGINQIPGMRCAAPSGAFYVFVSVEDLIGSRTPAGHVLETDAEIAKFFLESAGVATMPGSLFGTGGYLRLSFATPIEILDRAIDAMARAVETLSMRRFLADVVYDSVEGGRS